MASDLNTQAFCYRLIADDRTLGFIKTASFPTANSLVFECPFELAKPFLDSQSIKGYLPFRTWSLIVINVALQEIGRYTWRQARVARIRFPVVEYQSPKPLSFHLELAVVGVEQGGPDDRAFRPGPAGAATRDQSGKTFAIRSRIDGLESAEFSVRKIASFDIGGGAHEDLVLTATPEDQADPFRGWLSTGNAPKAVTFECLDSSLHAFFSIRLTGSRVRTVTPAFTTHSPGPATIHLMYSSISF